MEGLKREKGVGAMSRKKRASIGPGLFIYRTPQAA